MVVDISGGSCDGDLRKARGVRNDPSKFEGRLGVKLVKVSSALVQKAASMQSSV